MSDWFDSHEFRFFLDSGQIVALDLGTKETFRAWPKAMLEQIRAGKLAPFWSRQEVLDLLEQVLPEAQYPRTV